MISDCTPPAADHRQCWALIPAHRQALMLSVSMSGRQWRVAAGVPRERLVWVTMMDVGCPMSMASQTVRLPFRPPTIHHPAAPKSIHQ